MEEEETYLDLEAQHDETGMNVVLREVLSVIISMQLYTLMAHNKRQGDVLWLTAYVSEMEQYIYAKLTLMPSSLPGPLDFPCDVMNSAQNKGQCEGILSLMTGRAGNSKLAGVTGKWGGGENGKDLVARKEAVFRNPFQYKMRKDKSEQKGLTDYIVV